MLSQPVDVDRSPVPLAALVPSCRPVFDRLLAVCEADERIRAFWLSGSLAKGTADGGSDLDCLLAVRDGDFDGFAAGWRDWLATITPTLLAREPGALAAALRAVGNTMRTAGRAAVTACGGDWPVDLDDGVHRFVDQNLSTR